MTKCKECGNQVNTNAKTCPGCGTYIHAENSLGLLLIPVIGFVAMIAVKVLPELIPTVGYTEAAKTASDQDQTKYYVPDKPVPPSWSTYTSRDEMTGRLSAYAKSPATEPLVPMDFPYRAVRSQMGFGCDGITEWMYITFTQAPNLDDTDTRDGYNAITTRFKWDDDLRQELFTQKWGSKVLHFRGSAGAIWNALRSRRALLELKWHGQNSVHFPYSLNGSSKAISQARADCRSDAYK